MQLKTLQQVKHDNQDWFIIDLSLDRCVIALKEDENIIKTVGLWEIMAILKNNNQFYYEGAVFNNRHPLIQESIKRETKS